MRWLDPCPSEHRIINAVGLQWAEGTFVTPKPAPKAKAQLFGVLILAGIDTNGFLLRLSLFGHSHQIIGGIDSLFGSEVNDDVLLRRFVTFAIFVFNNAKFRVKRSVQISHLGVQELRSET